MYPQQNPVLLSEYGEPEPDLAAIVNRDYQRQVPRAEDALLLIEVADSSIGFDRARKLPMYAAAGIREAWLIDVQTGTIERHTDPSEGTYRLTVQATRGQEIESSVLPGLVLDAETALSR